MHNSIDERYAEMLHSQFEGAKKISASNWRFRCPYCGDSKKRKGKTRGNIYWNVKAKRYFFGCFNCGMGKTFPKFLEEWDSVLYQQYVVESYFSGNTKRGKVSEEVGYEELTKKIASIPLPEESSFARLPDSHYAKQYLYNRKIPVRHFKELYYTDDFFRDWVKVYIPAERIENSLSPGMDAVVIPFFDITGNMFAFQARFLSSSQRYITYKIDEAREKIYGLNRYDYNQPGYMVESPLDSLFLPNCLAFAGLSSFHTSDKKKIPDDIIFIADNEPKNKDVCAVMAELLDSGHKVVVWDDNSNEKEDINDMVLRYGVDKTIEKVNNCVCQGLAGKLKYENWKKI